jgi:signal transduction histidine kinase
LTEDLDALDRQVHRVTDMVSNVLDVSRFEAAAMRLHRAPVDLLELTREVLATFGLPGRPPAVRLDAPPGPVTVVIDSDVISRVVMNLVGNALKFAGSNGTVSVEITCSDHDVRLVVVDDGPGIAPEHQTRIFEKFAQVDRAPALASRSTGLGLTFCKLAIEAHAGRIGVESEVGRGSRFWFTVARA